MKQFIIKDYPDTLMTGLTQFINNEEVIIKIDPQSSLGDVLESFERFLKACGYHFDGHVEIVSEFENELLDNLGDDG